MTARRYCIITLNSPLESIIVYDTLHCINRHVPGTDTQQRFRSKRLSPWFKGTAKPKKTQLLCFTTIRSALLAFFGLLLLRWRSIWITEHTNIDGSRFDYSSAPPFSRLETSASTTLASGSILHTREKLASRILPSFEISTRMPRRNRRVPRGLQSC